MVLVKVIKYCKISDIRLKLKHYHIYFFVMTTFYNHQELEKKWQNKWEKSAAKKSQSGKKKYVLDMFPYPSGAGLHVGHVESYAATDIVSRYFKLNGYNVLHPQGWDAFGLPAENYAIQTGVHPKETTKKAISNFKRQMKSVGLSYDWSREINTSDPKFYKWTQWLFLQLYKKGLAYKKKSPVNWCDSCKTVLANEQVVDGKCERCENEVIQKDLEQWFFKVTKYAEELLKKIDDLDWPESLKTTQKNWIGKSEGALVDFEVQGSSDPSASSGRSKLQVFTTRPDTLFGATYMVIAPEHEIIQGLKSKIKNWKKVEKYINKAKKKNQLERTDLAKEKTGVELEGVKAINPANKKEIPIFIADYVLMGYGTGAIMAVPAHDERDYEFAKKYKLEIPQVIAPIFNITEGPDAVRPDKPTVKRRTAYSFIKHWKEDKYLCLDWEKFNWHSGIIGGVNDDEDIIEAAKREIQEETGYKNIRLVKEFCGEHHSCFFAGHKDENRYAVGYCFMFELIDDAWEEPDPEEIKNHKTVWIEGKKMGEFLNLSNFMFLWNQHLNKTDCYSGEGILVNSGKFNDLRSIDARDKITKYVKGKKEIQYKIRDWLISRQRYWGVPIPIVYCEKCGTVPVSEKDLPVLLPDDVDFKPTGESPLNSSKSFHKVKCPKCGNQARRESDTMDTFVCSSWYFLRYCDPKNEKEMFSKKSVKYWMPVDLYIGGMEHAVGHLIYARFITKVLRDFGYHKFDEPFIKIRNQGIILAEDSRKMSKRWKNIINPDDVIEEYGADTLRMYEMFMGPLEDAKPWDKKGIIGVRRFLERIYKFFGDIDKLKVVKNKSKLIHKTIKKVTDDIENIKFNTAISSLMIYLNGRDFGPKIDKSGFYEGDEVDLEALEKFLIILSPFAPHLSEELWQSLGHKETIFKQKWPSYNKKLVIEEEVIIVVQVNGKLRDTIKVSRGVSENDLKSKANELPNVKKHLEGKKIKKFIYIKDKLINIVT